MSKKNSSVILKKVFKNNKEISKSYLIFRNKLNSLKKNSFLVAVSGGPDSLALTAFSKAYSLEKKCKIYYVLIDHNLRKNSSKEALLVKKLLKKNQINLNIIKNKKIIKKNIQGNAREVRYNLLSSFCKKKQINIILTAHNLEDQVETFFIRLSRGSGLHGLSSMKQENKIKPGIKLVRPLLEFKKKQLIKISKEVFGTYYKDPSNINKKYLRTRIRSLKQIIEKSGIEYEQIFKSIKNLASSRDTLDLYLSKLYKESVYKEKNKIIINLYNFNNFNQEIKLKVLNHAIIKLTKAYYAPRSKKTLNLIDNLKSKNYIKSTLGGCTIFKKKDRIILVKDEKR